MADTPPPENSVHPKTRTEWRAWLESHHTQDNGVWLISYKKATGLAYVDYDSAVEEALCFGWIDSVPRKLDERRSMLYFAARKAGSGWSRLNKQRIAKMLDAGLMMPAGLAKLDAAKQDGSWSALDAVENLEIPDDLAAAFAEYDQAAANFKAFPRSAKRGILEWISNAKRPATRAKRIAETAELAQQNIRANQWPKRKP
ncbi:MAG: YdeI/OmpD-associated family protein [Deinococcota bacterium]